jgi:hypothetical protein
MGMRDRVNHVDGGTKVPLRIGNMEGPSVTRGL